MSFPPLYFFIAVPLTIAFYFIFPEFNIITWPYHLLGVLLIIGGGFVVNKSSNLFTQKDTTFYLDTPSVFVQSDFYQFSRNPMYVGAVILIFGLAILVGNLLSILVSILFFLAIHFLCIPPEEEMMEKTFGQAYLDYKQKVRRWL